MLRKVAKEDSRSAKSWPERIVPWILYRLRDRKMTPTLKQEIMAKNIASTLHIKLPAEKTKEVYGEYIHTYINKYKREIQRYN